MEEKKTRTRIPRSEFDQAFMEAVHMFRKRPFSAEAKAMMSAALEYKRKTIGDENITVL